MLDLRRLSMLREVAISGSITAAARALGLSAPAVSQQLARLERETGLVLLEAAGRGVHLTPIALELVQRTERVLEELESAEAVVLAGREGLNGVVRVAGFSTFASGALPLFINTLADRHPSLVVEFVQLDPEAAMNELTARRADLILADEYPGFPLRPGRGLVRTVVATETIAAYPPVGSDPRLSVAEFAELPWVMEPRGSEALQWAQIACRDLGFEPQVRYESPELHMHRGLVEAGLAAAFLPVSLADASAHDLTPSPLFPASLHRTIYAVTRSGAENRPGVRACLRTIEEIVAPALRG